MKSFRNCWTEVLPSLTCTYQNGMVVEKSIGWTMLQVLKGLDLKVSKNSHIALNVMKRGRDEKQSSCDCSHSFYIMSFLDLHSKICISQILYWRFHAESLRGGFYCNPVTEPEACEGMSKWRTKVWHQVIWLATVLTTWSLCACFGNEGALDTICGRKPPRSYE